MSKPVLLTVDDDPEVLSAVERDLRRHYRADYRIVKASSGREALDTTRELKQRGIPVALFLVDERMPGMTGTAFLVEAMAFYPDARKVLLTAYADTETAITAINRIGLDQYLLKPWDPPSEKLYPVLDDLLGDWLAHFRPPFEGIRVAGTLLSPESFAVKDFLSVNQVPYQWIDLDRDAPQRALAESDSPGLMRLPIVYFPQGDPLLQPSERELAERVGLQTRPQRPFYDLIVVGGGPAGLAGAVYGASEGLRTILVEARAPGGQAGTSSQIENYLGFPSGVSGSDLARRAVAQARRFGAEILTTQEVVEIRREDPYRIVRLGDGSELSSYAVMLAPGMEVRRLDAPGVDALAGTGIYYGAAMTEAAECRDKDVFIVGGANSAGQGAMFFSRYARTVTMVIRGGTLGAAMSRYLVDRIEATANISVLSGTRVAAVSGNGRLESITLADVATGATRDVAAHAMFIFIGAAPRTDIVGSLVQRDARGFILTGRDLENEAGRPRGWSLDREPFLFETNVPGIFAAGDARMGSGKRVASAVGEGSATVTMIHKYLETV